MARCRPPASIHPTPAVNVVPEPGRNREKYVLILSVSRVTTAVDAATADSVCSWPLK